MPNLLNLKKKHTLITFFFIGIIISIFYASFNLNKYDRNENNRHLMIRGDTLFIWKEAESFKKDTIENKSLFGNGIQYTRTFLPSKLIAIYSLTFGTELFESYDNIYDDLQIKNGGKFFFLLFQIILYYLSLIFLYKKLILFYDNKDISFFTTSYLAIDPNILQWHGTFWTESIFISLLLILIGMLIKLQKTILYCFSLGLFLGIVYLQKTTAIFFIVLILPYIYFSETKYSLVKSLNVLVGLIVILSLLAYDNFKKTGIFYFLPMQTKDAHYMSLVPTIYEENGKLEVYKKLKKKEESWKIQNSYSQNEFKSQKNLAEFKKVEALRVILENKIITFKIYFKKTIAHMVLNPFQTFYWHKYNQNKFQNTEFHLTDESKKYFLFKIFYSTVFYPILLLGFISILKNRKNLKFHLLIFFVVLYLMFMLGWVGNSRYFIPSIIFLSIYFGHGLNYLKKL